MDADLDRDLDLDMDIRISLTWWWGGQSDTYRQLSRARETQIGSLMTTRKSCSGGEMREKRQKTMEMAHRHNDMG